MAAEHGPTTERREGPTPNGGVRSEAHYRDAAGNPCPKGKATHVEIHEYDARGNSIHRTHATLGRPRP